MYLYLFFSIDYREILVPTTMIRLFLTVLYSTPSGRPLWRYYEVFSGTENIGQYEFIRLFDREGPYSGACFQSCLPKTKATRLFLSPLRHPLPEIQVCETREKRWREGEERKIQSVMKNFISFLEIRRLALTQCRTHLRMYCHRQSKQSNILHTPVHQGGL